MNGKRFMLDDAGELIDLNNHKFINYGEECCNLLNELHEENKELKKENVQFDILIKNNQLAYIDLEKENEQLQHELLCKKLDKAPTKPINCKCHYEVKE